MALIEEQIRQQTFRELGIRGDIPPGHWIVSYDSNIHRYAQYRRAILTGICEVLGGAHMFRLDLTKMGAVTVELPPDIVDEDALEGGFALCRFEVNRVWIGGLITGKNGVEILPSPFDWD